LFTNYLQKGIYIYIYRPHLGFKNLQNQHHKLELYFQPHYQV
jgi:hypothetical protein